MDGWSIAQLRAHQQFTMGRIDGLRWVLERVDLLGTEDCIPERDQIRDRIREHEATQRDVEARIDNILAKRESEKQQRIKAREETHKTFGGQ